MSQDRVLLVEDAKDMQKMVRASLEGICDLHCVDNLKDADAELQSGSYSLLVLDVSLPDGDGFEFCREIRMRKNLSDLPIVFLTGRSGLDHRVLGFELGADDYVTKPFEPEEFAARVGSKLRRGKRGATTFRKAGIRVDLETQKASLCVEGDVDQALNLTPIEFKLIVHFLRNENQVLSKEDLITAAWGADVFVSAHTVDTHISSLRKKIGPHGKSIKTVLKRGYVFTVPSEEN